MKQVNLRLTDEEIAGLKSRAKAEGRSLSNYVRSLLFPTTTLGAIKASEFDPAEIPPPNQPLAREQPLHPEGTRLKKGVAVGRGAPPTAPPASPALRTQRPPRAPHTAAMILEPFTNTYIPNPEANLSTLRDPATCPHTYRNPTRMCVACGDQK